ncbi:cupin domain-containing protein [Paramagnetospirillum marisnigri]|nr:cupin domain-containing protein [Paramagnetospirillum marisnigri]
MTDQSMTFADVLAPVGVDSFIRDYFEKKPLILHREDRTYFDRLLTLDDIDRHLNFVGHKFPDIAVANALEEIPTSEYVVGGDRIDKNRVYQLFDQGATIVMRKMHTFVPALARLVRSAEKQFSCEFQCNVYFTPPGAKQGFKIHYDTHDIFALQVIGAKTWRIYGTPVEMPLVGQDYDRSVMQPGERTQEFDLKSGDMYYFPRGLVHDCVTPDEPSVHITLGMLSHTWTELFVEALMGVCQEDAEFRRYLPIGAMGPDADPATMEASFRALVERFAEKVKLAPALERFRDGFITSRQPDTLGRSADYQRLGQLTASSSVGPRADLIYRLQDNGDTVSLHVNTAEIKLPAAAASALKFTLESPRFSIGDVPGLADDSSKLTLVRRLVREGLLTIH